LESKLKYHINKLNIETEAKAVSEDYLSIILIYSSLCPLKVVERKLEEEKNAPNKMEEKANGGFVFP